jgi:hypothetical protein
MHLPGSSERAAKRDIEALLDTPAVLDPLFDAFCKAYGLDKTDRSSLIEKLDAGEFVRDLGIEVFHKLLKAGRDAGLHQLY